MEINKEYPCHKDNYSSGSVRKNKIEYIVIHYTGNNNDRAVSNCKYFQSSGRGASAHFFVDQTSIYESVSEDYVAWSVGGKLYPNYKETGGGKFYNKCTNNNSISIELCDSVKSVPQKTRENALWLIKQLMKKYNIDTDHIIRHFDVNGKHCPASFVDNAKDFESFKKELQGVKEVKSVEATTKKIKLSINGVVTEVEAIEYSGNNFVKLQDLRSGNIVIGYDSQLKMPIITTR